MSALETINPNADLIGGNAALMINISAAKVLQDILKTNLGPRGTMKMYGFEARRARGWCTEFLREGEVRQCVVFVASLYLTGCLQVGVGRRGH